VQSYPMKVYDVLLGQPFLWNCHVIYEFIPCYVIITLGEKLYKIPEVVPPTIFSLIFAKEFNKIIS